MKKQILLIAVISSAILFSCKKEKLETSPAQSAETSMENKTVPTPGIVINTLNVGLAGKFEFDGSLKDATGKLEDAYPTSAVSRLGALYTADRKGQANKAIRFNGKYGVDIFDVPSTPQGCSFSVWIKNDTIPPNWLGILYSWKGFSLSRGPATYLCSFWNGPSNPVGQSVYSSFDNNWHHIAVTRDNSVMKFYVDGVLFGSSPSDPAAGDYFPLNNYSAGYGYGSFWKGNMDDLRLYKRVLSPTEVTQLYNL